MAVGFNGKGAQLGAFEMGSMGFMDYMSPESMGPPGVVGVSINPGLAPFAPPRPALAHWTQAVICSAPIDSWQATEETAADEQLAGSLAETDTPLGSGPCEKRSNDAALHMSASSTAKETTEPTAREAWLMDDPVAIAEANESSVEARAALSRPMNFEVPTAAKIPTMTMANTNSIKVNPEGRERGRAGMATPSKSGRRPEDRVGIARLEP